MRLMGWQKALGSTKEGFLPLLMKKPICPLSRDAQFREAFTPSTSGILASVNHQKCLSPFLSDEGDCDHLSQILTWPQ